MLKTDLHTHSIASGHALNTVYEMVREAKEKGMGVILMKVVRPRETVKGLNPEDLVRYALSLKGPDVIVLGLDSIEVVKSNLEILRNFQPMDEAKISMSLNVSPAVARRRSISGTRRADSVRLVLTRDSATICSSTATAIEARDVEVSIARTFIATPCWLQNT